MVASFVAYFLTPIEKLAASSATPFKVLKTKHSNAAWLETSTAEHAL
jgi:hypothetical protein